jgi:hypothetical protein
MGQLQAWAKDVTQEVQTEDGGYEYIVEGAGAKVAWTLPPLWNERQLPYATELLPSGRETRLQMGKQAQPEEKLQLGSVSQPEPVEDVLLKSRMRKSSRPVL